ncbi:MAG: tetratricopeptide repeat protein [Bryobacteraceae bacterium]
MNFRLPGLLFLACAMWAQGPAEELARAMQLAGQGRFAEAEQALRPLEQAHPKEFEIRYRLGLILLRQGKTGEAAERLETAAQLAPDSPLAWLAVAQTRLKLGRREPALEAAGRAAKLAPKDPAVWRALAMFYRMAKDPAKAVEAYQKAIRQAPEQPEPYFDLAGLFLDHRTPEPAVAVLESAVARFPKESEFWRLLGLAHYQTGNIGKAIDAFLAVSDLDPDSEVGYASLETLLAEAGSRLPEIVTRLREFRKRQPAIPVGHFLLAKALTVERARAAEVEALLREAIRTEPKFWPAQYELGQLLEAQGKPEEAVRALAQAVTLNPEYAPAHYSLARLCGQLGDRARAVEHRKAHHELLKRQREAAERARAENPALPYRIEAER